MLYNHKPMSHGYWAFPAKAPPAAPSTTATTTVTALTTKTTTTATSSTDVARNPEQSVFQSDG